jgi:acetolactate decarboxylase
MKGGHIMKKQILLLLIIIIIFTGILSGEKKIFQYSTVNALMIGQYDGHFTLKELKNYGNFGIGTFDKLNGEMVALDNIFYQIDYKGKVNIMDEKVTTPFAAVTFFDADTSINISNISSFKELGELINSYLPTKNIFYAIKISGDFNYIKTRSVPPQEKPYERLLKIASNQPEFEYNNISGILAGFFTPEYIININVPGYHLHFLSDDKSSGGHLLECDIQEAIIHISYISSFEMKLPDSQEFYENDLLNVEDDELHKIEK